MTFGMKILTEKENMIVIYEMLAQLPLGWSRPFSPASWVPALTQVHLKSQLRGSCVFTQPGLIPCFCNFLFKQLRLLMLLKKVCFFFLLLRNGWRRFQSKEVKPRPLAIKNLVTAPWESIRLNSSCPSWSNPWWWDLGSWMLANSWI